MFRGLSTSWRMPQPTASSLGKNIIQSTFTLPATTHSSIHPFTYPLNRQRNNRERTDFPPVCLMTRQALILWRMSQNSHWGRTSSKVQSLFQQPTHLPSCIPYDSIKKKKKKKKRERKAGFPPVCLMMRGLLMPWWMSQPVLSSLA